LPRPASEQGLRDLTAVGVRGIEKEDAWFLLHEEARYWGQSSRGYQRHSRDDEPRACALVQHRGCFARGRLRGQELAFPTIDTQRGLCPSIGPGTTNQVDYEPDGDLVRLAALVAAVGRRI
jgi:hypothetical protein